MPAVAATAPPTAPVRAYPMAQHLWWLVDSRLLTFQALHLLCIAAWLLARQLVSTASSPAKPSCCSSGTISAGADDELRRGPDGPSTIPLAAVLAAQPTLQ